MPKVDINARLAQRTAQESGAALEKAYNDMFGLPTGVESIVTLPLDCLHLYKDDPFKDRSGEELEQLIRSIRENGQQEPIIVRPLAEKGQYEILAGRRRRNAIQANGGTEINAVIRDVDDDTAIMIVTETNLRNREKLLPSEKAFAYKLQLEAIKRQGKRTDLLDASTSARIAQKLSRDIIAEKNDVSKDEIQRYIRLTYLIPPFLDLVDAETIPLYAGVDLSHLDEDAQTMTHAFFFDGEYGVKLDLKLSASLRAVFKENDGLTEEMIETLCLDKQKYDQPKTFSINRKKLKPYLDRLPDNAELERLFLEFLETRFGKEIA